MYSRIVVPLDGSPLAEQALQDATALARLTGASLHLIRIVDYTRLESYGPYGMAIEYGSVEPVISQQAQEAREYLDALNDRYTAEGLTVSSDVRRGVVVREIIETTQSGDLIAMASHGRGGLTRWLLGSVAEEIIRHATSPVLLVRVAKPG